MSDRTPALDGYCPVAYFLADEPLKGAPEYASTYDGKTYHFVSEEARATFEKDPQKYLPAYDGACALGMSMNERFDVDPTSYKIVGDRLLLFLKNDEIDALKVWNDKDEAELLAQADANFAAANGSQT